MTNARRMLEALSLSLRMVAGRASPAASARTPGFGAQTSRAGNVLNGAGLAGLLLLGAVLLPAAPALAQTQPIVSNLDEATSSNFSQGRARIAIGFTTGANAAGYTLTSAVLPRTVPGAGDDTVSIHNASGSGPGTLLGTLTGPATIPTTANYIYTSSGGIALAPATTYYLATRIGRGVQFTNSANQTSSDNWDIITRTDGRLPYRHDFSGNWSPQAFSTGSTIKFSLSVRPFPPSFVGRTIADQTYTAGTAITDLTLPAASGSSNLSYMLEPDPPAGLSFNTGTRILSGTPATAMAAAAYTYTATIAATTSSTSLNFTIRVLPPDAVRMRLRVFLEGPLQ